MELFIKQMAHQHRTLLFMYTILIKQVIILQKEMKKAGVNVMAYIRGWMRTNEKGEYKFFTLRPAAYPGRKDPEHIHITIKEPDKNEYWIDEYVFDDDPLLTDSQRKNCQDRGGSGILKVKDVGNMLKAERNIYLGKNIPDYPKQ